MFQSLFLKKCGISLSNSINLLFQNTKKTFQPPNKVQKTALSVTKDAYICIYMYIYIVHIYVYTQPWLLKKNISRNIFSFLLLAKCLVFKGLKITYYSSSENCKSSFSECLGLQKCREKTNTLYEKYLLMTASSAAISKAILT